MFLNDLSCLFCIGYCECSGFEFPCIVLVVGETDVDKNPKGMAALLRAPFHNGEGHSSRKTGSEKA